MVEVTGFEPLTMAKYRKTQPKNPRKYVIFVNYTETELNKKQLQLGKKLGKKFHYKEPGIFSPALFIFRRYIPYTYTVYPARRPHL